MKKILEVLQYGDMDIRFNTDFDPAKNQEVIVDVIARVAFAMTTRLWGGNEQAVLAMIRALAIADLSVSVNRKQMLKHFETSSEAVAKTMTLAKEEFERKGGRVITFGPGIMPNGQKS
ncbi:MAG: hypothetical protein II031_05555 [Bacteroidales bacterium]|jgi:hypothetical protein|nr:hypothetical protein [Bacteroidales bacterium]